MQNLIEKTPVHGIYIILYYNIVEVCLKEECSIALEEIRNYVQQYLTTFNVISSGYLDYSINSALNEILLSLKIEIDNNQNNLPFWQVDFIIHIFAYCCDGDFEEELDSESGVPACNQWILPAIEYKDLWDSYNILI